MRRMRTWTARWLLLSAWLFVAAACSRTPEGSATTTSSSDSPSATTPTPSTDPDFRTIDGQVIGDGTYPAYTLEVPVTWSVSGGFAIDRNFTALGVSVWDVGEVPRDPCKWKDSSSDPGPAVDDLVGALTAQRFREASEPTDVELGGAEGQYLVWSVPEDWKVTGDADFAGCDEQDNGHQDFVSWFGDGIGERYQQDEGQVDMLWVLDVDGERLLVDATYTTDTTQASRERLMAVVDSLRFTG